MTSVNTLLADAQTNAAAWQPQAGDKAAIIVQVPRLSSVLQLVILELPYVAAGNGTNNTPPSSQHLTISPEGANVVLKWSTNATGFSLQSTRSLSDPVVWTTLAAQAAVVNGLNVVTNPVTEPQQFFRLEH
jgi:hypothetical protein